MAKYSRLQVLNQMNESGMVPLFYNNDIDSSKAILTACYEGGARLMEFTNRGDFALEVFSALIKYSIKELPGMIIGIGSVTDAAAASQYMLHGANFVVTPVFRKDIAIVCNRRKVLWTPGCGSLTEIAKAEEMGCEIVKLFPGNTYGPGFIKAINIDLFNFFKIGFQMFRNQYFSLKLGFVYSRDLFHFLYLLRLQKNQ